MLEEPEGGGGGAPEWMVTFADLMSLLLTFFVLLLSFANMEVVKFETAMGSIQNALGLRSEFELSDVPAGGEILPEMSPAEGSGGGPTEAERQVVDELERILLDAGLLNEGSVKIDPRGVVLQLEGDVFFESGDAAINNRALPVLDALATYAARQSRFLDVVGHTDNVPIATAFYPSNWELSAARAGQAVRYLAEKGVKPDRMRAIGQAHTVPVAENTTTIGRATNRRVEFAFVTELQNLNPADLENSDSTADFPDRTKNDE